jgi:hypothetical protein
MPRGEDNEEVDYNPRSTDASFAKLFTRMDSFEANTGATLKRIEDKVDGQGTRIEKIEKDSLKNRLMAASGLAAAGHHLSTLLFK